MGRTPKGIVELDHDADTTPWDRDEKPTPPKHGATRTGRPPACSCTLVPAVTSCPAVVETKHKPVQTADCMALGILCVPLPEGQRVPPGLCQGHGEEAVAPSASQGMDPRHTRREQKPAPWDWYSRPLRGRTSLGFIPVCNGSEPAPERPERSDSRLFMTSSL